MEILNSIDSDIGSKIVEKEIVVEYPEVVLPNPLATS